jgi:hypothetical protein
MRRQLLPVVLAALALGGCATAQQRQSAIALTRDLDRAVAVREESQRETQTLILRRLVALQADAARQDYALRLAERETQAHADALALAIRLRREVAERFATGLKPTIAAQEAAIGRAGGDAALEQARLGRLLAEAADRQLDLDLRIDAAVERLLASARQTIAAARATPPTVEVEAETAKLLAAATAAGDAWRSEVLAAHAALRGFLDQPSVLNLLGDGLFRGGVEPALGAVLGDAGAGLAARLRAPYDRALADLERRAELRFDATLATLLPAGATR